MFMYHLQISSIDTIFVSSSDSRRIFFVLDTSDCTIELVAMVESSYLKVFEELVGMTLVG